MNICKMRIKNAEPWVARAIGSVADIFDKILIFNDYSTDKTVEICESFDNVVIYNNPFKDRFDGARDQSYLTQKALEFYPNWILTLDGDEILTEYTREELVKVMKKQTTPFNTIVFKFLYYWNEKNKIRVDGIYDKIFIPRMFCLVGMEDEKIIETIDFNNLSGCHASLIPAGRFKRIDYTPKPPLSVEHYGYFTKEERIKKYWFYVEKDNSNRFEDEYKHIVIGDLLPVNTVTKHAGPLKLVEVKND